MKKSTLLIIATVFLLNSLLVQSCRQAPADDIPAMLERKTTLGSDNEKATILDTYNKAKDAIKKDTNDLQQYIKLASAFVAEGRITGNSNYYANAAVKMLNKVMANPHVNKDQAFQTLSLKSAVLLNMHQFKDALDAAKRGVALNDFNAGIYGALVDANVELGNYDEAVKDCDKMMSIRPDLRSYSRVSYLRQIYGQNAGAIEAMKMAVDAGIPGAEATEWARTTLGDLYLNTGNLDSAAIIYRTSLVYRPDYPFALIGMARVDKARKDYDGAIVYTKKAIGILSEGAFVSLLGELYELKGDATKATETYNDVVSLMEQADKEQTTNAVVKHNTSREMATAYLNAGNLEKAMVYAKTDLAMRPENIDANELISWIYYRKGDFANAKLHADKVLATKTMNGNTLYKVATVYASAGEVTKGNELMRMAMTVNPYIDQRLVNQTKQSLVKSKG